MIIVITPTSKIGVVDGVVETLLMEDEVLFV